MTRPVKFAGGKSGKVERVMTVCSKDFGGAVVHNRRPCFIVSIRWGLFLLFFRGDGKVRNLLFPVILILFGSSIHLCGAEGMTREQKVRADQERFAKDQSWIYNDFSAALQEAKKSGKPILAVMRCLPCEECVKLDDALLDSHPKIQALRKDFVSVRIVSNNGLDLNRFRIDTDQSFSALMFNPDGKLLGRYGTRSHRTQWEDDVSVDGLAAALQGAMELHRAGDKVSSSLDGKQPKPMDYQTPEQLPGLKGKYSSKLDPGPNIVKSCIHCHQVGEAIRDVAWQKAGKLTEEALFVYPHPKVVGLIIDPRTRTTVRRVIAGSAAAKMGALPGDEIIEMAGQPLISMADIQWVLQAVPATGGEVKAKIKRRGELVDASLVLQPGWRSQDDISWRTSTWELRRRVLGGMLLRNPEQGADKQKVLEVGHVGQYAPHDRARQAGIKTGDRIISIGGRTDFTRETDVIWHLLQTSGDGKPYVVEVSRGGDVLKMQLTVK